MARQLQYNAAGVEIPGMEAAGEPKAIWHVRSRPPGDRKLKSVLRKVSKEIGVGTT